MANEIKTVGSVAVNENKGNLVDFNEKKGKVTSKYDKKYFEQILHQIKLLMHQGKLIANSGNNVFNQLDEIENLEKFIQSQDNLTETDLNSENNFIEDNKLLDVINIKNAAAEDLGKKVVLDAIEIGLITQIITNNTQNLDEGQLLAYAKKWGLTKKQSSYFSKLVLKGKVFRESNL